MQAPEPELGEQYEPVCDSTYSEAESAAAEVLDLPLPSYFRSRSHSYLRAIQAGCSQEDDTGSVRSISPPPTGSLSGSRTLPTNSSECGGVRGQGHGWRCLRAVEHARRWARVPASPAVADRDFWGVLGLAVCPRGWAAAGCGCWNGRRALGAVSKEV